MSYSGIPQHKEEPFDYYKQWLFDLSDPIGDQIRKAKHEQDLAEIDAIYEKSKIDAEIYTRDTIRRYKEKKKEEKIDQNNKYFAFSVGLIIYILISLSL